MAENARRERPPLLAVLELEQLDEHRFLSTNAGGSSSRPWIFGGQIIAQAARAASLTVHRTCVMHSLHASYVSAGRADVVTELQIDRDRDGRSFTTRHVVARQEGAVVLRLLASFHVEERGQEYQTPDLPDVVDVVPPPEDLIEQSTSVHREVFDVRALGLGPAGGAYWRTPHRFWARARGPLPPEPFLSECVLAYLSDVGTGLAKLPDTSTGHGPSLDHAVWFHREPDVNDWVFVDLTPVSTSRARGLCTGTVQDRAGHLIATIAQEQLARDFSPR